MSTDFSKGAAWMDGKITPVSEAKISVLDWGFTRSDCTYDVASVRNGAFFRLNDYLERFQQSLAKVRISVPQKTEEMRDIVHSIVGRSGLRDSYVAMVACRGVPLVPGTRDPRQCGNHFFAWCIPYVHVIKPEIAARGAHLFVPRDVRRIPPDSVDSTAKNYHWGDMTKGLFEALDAGFDTAMLLDHRGNVTEGPGFNVFSLKGNCVRTPDTGVLEGITRRTVLELCGELGLETEVRPVSLSEFMESDEVFTSSTGGGVAPVTRINERVFSNDAPGPATRRISETYLSWFDRPEHRQPVTYA
ncbi:aminotransferase class IV [Anderseniella sp. Alg231-50]|uniref:aminotransferase class IV n=1 Tax=Anderseniella sp. Alg231-50 TaxID=1922226 RepID=UPI000D54CB93